MFATTYRFSKIFINKSLIKKYSCIPDLIKPVKGKKTKCCCAEEAFCEALQSNQTIFIQGAAATPMHLVRIMAKLAKDKNLCNITTCHIHCEGKFEHVAPEMEGIFRDVSFFMGGNVRKAVADGRADCIPIFLSDIPKVFYKKIYKPDISLINCTPPDKNGFCSIGTSVDCTVAAMTHSKCIIAQINKCMPRTFGHSVFHYSHIDYAVEHHESLPTHGGKPPNETAIKIGKLIAENLIKDGSTLQMGIGNIPDAVLTQLKNHKDLGIHSEMFADGVVDLVKLGCITNNKKTRNVGKTVGSFLIGTKKLYDFVDDNPTIDMFVVDYVNSSKVIAYQPNMVAINSCIEIDLTGQIVSDSIGTRIFSGFGGQVDFIRGAAETYDGQGIPIIAMPSLAKKGDSKIVPFIQKGAGVVTTRGHSPYVVTEYGYVDLFGKTLRQRAYELIRIAHPDHREKLEKAAFERLKTMPAK